MQDTHCTRMLAVAFGAHAKTHHHHHHHNSTRSLSEYDKDAGPMNSLLILYVGCRSTRRQQTSRAKKTVVILCILCIYNNVHDEWINNLYLACQKCLLVFVFCDIWGTGGLFALAKRCCRFCTRSSLHSVHSHALYLPPFVYLLLVSMVWSLLFAKHRNEEMWRYCKFVCVCVCSVWPKSVAVHQRSWHWHRRLCDRWEQRAVLYCHRTASHWARDRVQSNICSIVMCRLCVDTGAFERWASWRRTERGNKSCIVMWMWITVSSFSPSSSSVAWYICETHAHKCTMREKSVCLSVLCVRRFANMNAPYNMVSSCVKSVLRRWDDIGTADGVYRACARVCRVLHSHRGIEMAHIYVCTTTSSRTCLVSTRFPAVCVDGATSLRWEVHLFVLFAGRAVTSCLHM